MENSMKCPRCGSYRTKKKGFDKGANGMKVQTFACNDCGRRFLSKTDCTRAQDDEKLDKGTKGTSGVNDQVIVTQNDPNEMTIEIPRTYRIKTLKDLLEKMEVDQKVWMVQTHMINKYEMAMKGLDGKSEITELYQVKATLVKIKPEKQLFPALQSLHFNPKEYKQADKEFRNDVQTAVIISDIHFGFMKNQRTNELDPFHDREALDIILQVVSDMQPDEIIINGDLLDLANFSDKFIRLPEFYFTTQPSLIEAGWFLSQLRKLSPEATITYVMGNHTARIEKMLITHFMSAYDLRPVNNMELPVMSIENLLGLKDLDIAVVDEYWINENLKAVHGDIVRNGNGETVKTILKNSRYSTVSGHTHRLELITKSVEGKKGRELYSASSFGCLCRLDGITPGSSKDSNWSQGFGLVHFTENRFETLPVVIHEGVAMVEGTVYTGNDYKDQLEGISEFHF